MKRKKSDQEIKEAEFFIENIGLAKTTTDPDKINLLTIQEDKYIKANILKVKDQKKPKDTLTLSLLENKGVTEDQLGQLFDVLYNNWKDANKMLNSYRHTILSRIAGLYIELLQRNDVIVKPITKAEKEEYEYTIRERKALLGYIEQVIPDVLSLETVKRFKRAKK